jgi:hypothetical protein
MFRFRVEFTKRMDRLAALALAVLLLCARGAHAQIVVHRDEHLASDRPEAWAMNYVAASTFMTGFGATPVLAPGDWSVDAVLAYIPRLSEVQQRIGFNGTKFEDLNKTPVFGRARLMVGLPSGFVAELGYTPALQINGTTPRDLFAVAIGRRLFDRTGFSLSARLFGQHGRVGGDITCPAKLAGITDRQQNPFGCQTPSDDRLALNYYGVELTSAWDVGGWQLHLGLGAVRSELSVQVDALTFDERDRSRLDARGALPFATVGVSRDIAADWSVGIEWLYVPLYVRRPPDFGRERDPLTSVRLQLRHRFG